MANERDFSCDVESHCRQIDRCNQRGGRMLSVVDLIEAGTVTPELAAYLLAAIGGGASFMVGAEPGGAGKTTVMGAMLNFVPADIALAAAADIETIERGLTARTPRRCFICHEIGSGPYYAYLWGEPLRRYFRLAEAGHMLAANLHADTYEQARRQVCETNNVPEPALRRMNLMLFLSVGRRGRGRRCVEEVWESDGHLPHRKVYDASDGRLQAVPSAFVGAEALASASRTIGCLLTRGVRTIQEVRAAMVESTCGSARPS